MKRNREMKPGGWISLYTTSKSVEGTLVYDFKRKCKGKEMGHMIGINLLQLTYLDFSVYRQTYRSF